MGLEKEISRDAKIAVMGRGETPRVRQSLIDWLAVLGANWKFGVFALAVFLLKMWWGVWWSVDLPPLLPNECFTAAYRWYHAGRIDLIYPPLYTVFFGSFFSATPDAYFVTLAHWVLLLCSFGLLVLAVARQLLSPVLGWLVAAGSVYLAATIVASSAPELFGLSLGLAACLVSTRLHGARGPLAAAAILVILGFLVRREFVIAAAVVSAATIGWLAARSRPARTASRRRLFRQGMWAHAVLLLTIVGLFAFAKQSADRGAKWGSRLERRYTTEFARGFAKTYWSRTSGGTVATEDATITKEFFGKRWPTISMAWKKNPKAMLRHCWFNARALPGRVARLLRGDSELLGQRAPPSGILNYLPVLIVFLLPVAHFFGVRNRAARHRFWMGRRFRAWIVLGGIGIASLTVAIIEHPRAADVLCLALILLVAAAASCQRFVALVGTTRRPWSALGPIAILVVLVFTPRLFPSSDGPVQQPLLTAYRRLAPYVSSLRKGRLLAPATLEPELTAYLMIRKPNLSPPAVYRDWLDDPRSSEMVNTDTPTFLYVDEEQLRDRKAAQQADLLAAAGWTILRWTDSMPRDRWLLGERPPAP